MKFSINRLLLVSLAAFTLGSCTKDEVKAILQQGAPPSLNASQNTLVLDGANADDPAVAFNWTAASYGYDAAVQYTLQFDIAGNDFASPRNVDLGSLLTREYTVAEFNQMALLLGISPGAATPIEARVKAEISPNVDPAYSNTVTVTTTPYLVVVNYPSWYVPGDYQGWNPATAEKIASKGANDIYEGFVYFAPGGTFEFKFTDAPDWSNGIYGDQGAGNSGVLSSPGNNFKLTTAGYYRLNANKNNMTWSATRTDWGLIGSATPDGWNSDQNLTYNTGTKEWSITLNLVAGEIKFRANDDWGINFGDDGLNLSLEYNGANIPIAEAGNYTITLKLGVPGNYSYSVVKN